LKTQPDSKNSSKRSSISEHDDAEIIPRNIHALCTKKTKEFIAQLAKKASKMGSDELGEEVSSFYIALTRLIEPKLSGDDQDAKVARCMELAEEQLTEAFYNRLFSNEADETKDLDLQRAIRAFHWIGPAMLGAKLDRSRVEVSALMDQAVNCFLQTNAALLPRDKIAHLSSGVSTLAQAIEVSTRSPAGADDLLPAIIYLLIYTNPPLLVSNLNLIRRLSPPELLRRGEQAYHYCSICSAVGFVEHGITAKHLNLTRKQFDMFHQNQAKPPLALMESTFPRMDKIGNIFTKDGDDDVSFSSPALEKIKSIKRDNDRFFERARSLRQEMAEWSLSVAREADAILERYPLEIKRIETVDSVELDDTPSSASTLSSNDN